MIKLRHPPPRSAGLRANGNSIFGLPPYLFQGASLKFHRSPNKQLYIGTFHESCIYIYHIYISYIYISYIIYHISYIYIYYHYIYIYQWFPIQKCCVKIMDWINMNKSLLQTSCSLRSPLAKGTAAEPKWLSQTLVDKKFITENGFVFPHQQIWGYGMFHWFSQKIRMFFPSDMGLNDEFSSI